MKIIIKCTDGIMTGKEWRFNGSGQITLGREKGSMVTTAPEDNSISRHQCVIDVVPPNVYVSDAGSTHGTYVNRVKLIGEEVNGRTVPGQRWCIYWCRFRWKNSSISDSYYRRRTWNSFTGLYS
ncbi:MAG: FHA domain-containing protein [Anaerobutyricum soehngenii]